ncbi:ATP-binding cassette domain-containing protein [Sharpea azabuensis]|uniref:ATP-binding cassette domain-containing protein n=1 Tax=Sharpea azabuensis TaxID=322505 RepID=UPI001565F5DE|nr:ABC transporter ATP-binding protein [Sharpea azabuensis]
MPTITIHNLTKSFQEHHVIQNLNLTIESGDCIYIHGMNGCGKSTLLKMIAGILKPDCGTIEESDDVEIGALIENPGFIETESLAYNLHFLANLKHHFDQNKISQLCSRYHLDYNDKTAIKKYSLGMRQKAGIIQAIMENQNIILLDEPTRGLDKESIQIFIHHINNLILENKAIIIASHDYHEDIHFTKIYKMEEGHLV